MPEYQVRITKTAQKQLDKIPSQIANKLFDLIQSLATNPRPPGCKKLKGRDGFPIRKGDFRIFYDVFDRLLIVEVIAVGDRKDIYY